MDASKLFDGFDPTQYEREVEERWGKTDEYAESARRTKKYTREDWGRIQREAAQILDELADAMRGGVAASAEEATELAERHRLHIDRWYYPCSRAMHASLADMYESDERFAAHFEKQGEGLTAYLVEAIRTNLDRQ